MFVVSRVTTQYGHVIVYDNSQVLSLDERDDLVESNLINSESDSPLLRLSIRS